MGATALTYQLLFWLLPRMPLVVVGAMPVLDTLVAVLLGVVMLGERVDSSLLLGGVLILSSAALANFAPSSSPEEAPEDLSSEPEAAAPQQAA